ncbi:MAG: hypothetical protein ACLSB9_20080 [Hydrogeniiclostridium mannosilyticum]
MNADGGTCKLSGGVYQGGIYGVLNSTSGAVKTCWTPLRMASTLPITRVTR